MDTKDRPVYIISVAAELVDMHPQTLRLYERKGLIEPKRSGGKTRLYSERDVEKLKEIRRLTQELGVNLAGVEEIIRLREELWTLEGKFKQQAQKLKDELGDRIRDFAQSRALTTGNSTEPLEDETQRGVYVISVAAELVGMHPQTLRLYEREGLLAPSRTSGKTRLYSEHDVEKLKEIRRLTQELGVNLAGVEEIIRLRDELDTKQSSLELEIGRLQLALASGLSNPSE